MQRRLGEQASLRLAHASELMVLERLLDFGADVHHERVVPDDRLGDGFTTHDQPIGVGGRFYRDSLMPAPPPFVLGVAWRKEATPPPWTISSPPPDVQRPPSCLTETCC